MATVLVTDGDQRAALAVVRSLGRAGHRVVVAASGRRSIAGASRHAALTISLPEPISEPQRYAQAVGRHVKEHGIDVILPVTEPAILALLDHRAAVGAAVVPLPDLDTFRRASDKAWVALAARQAGLPVPGQRIVESPEDAREVDGCAEMPTVLKPARSVHGGLRHGVSYVPAGVDVAQALLRLPREAFPVLVQERIMGSGTGIFLLRWQGRTMAAFAHRRLREKPPSGGVSVLRESVPLDPDLLAASEALLTALDWRGVAMVELKMDERTDTAHVMEINGRFWGSLQLAIDAGVDFPALLVDLALGNDVEPCLTYEVGVRSRWLMGDVDHLIIRMTRSSERLDLPLDAPGRPRVLMDFLRGFLPPNREEVLRPTDPMPFVAELQAWLRAFR